ncbi:hypothetical protein GCM10023210_30800 [Chryseobacterium ginsengisoli]|uniref:Secretion system C-terminal sorting domain-containing protein n=1 Tax=Chryseobacterium ginsengisoli TaxID=363853 RepID=A0ABP9MHJ4_9FLAO
MKKIYSLFATVIFASTVCAQIFSANFSDLNGTGGNDGSWSGNVGTSSLNTYTSAGWTFGSAGGAAQCVKAGSGSNPGSVTTPVLAGLSGNAAVSFRAGGFGTDDTTLTVSVTGGGSVSGTKTFTLTNGAFTTFNTSITGGTASTKLVFSSSAGGRRFFIDDIIVSAGSVLAVSDIKGNKVSLVKNTLVDNNIVFGTKSEIKIFGATGNLVKTASVFENEVLDISGLPKGNYIVSGIVAGKLISEKILKK